MSRSTRNARARSARNGDPVPAGSSTDSGSSTRGPFKQKRDGLTRARNSWEAARNHWAASCRALREASPMDEGYFELVAMATNASEAYVTASQAFLRACEKV